MLRAGAAGKATIALGPKGPALALPALPLAQPATVRLRADTGARFEAAYGAPAAKNTAGPPPVFKDKAD